MDDLLNNEIGGIVRVKDINALREFAIGNAATAALPAIQFYDEAIRAKTGVTGAAMGMDANALQSQTAAGVNAAVQAASAVSELIARNLAEGGMRQMFRLIAQIARANPNPNEMMRLDGQFVPVDPRSWTSDLDLVTNVGLGNNHRDERIAALQMTMQTQMQVWQTYGPSNGIVTMTGIRNTLADILGMAGIHNADRYYNQMNPQIEQQLMMQAAQAAQGQQPQQPSDPNMAFLQSEQMKTATRAQVDMAKVQLDAEKMRMDDDRERDRMAQDLAIRAGELLAKTGVQLDLNAIKREQQMPRMQFVPNQTTGF
jgi:outer membrane translocation and assembly module TamA